MYLCIASRDKNHFDITVFDQTSKKETLAKEASNLLVAVDEVLQHHSLTKEDIQGILVVLGTGTFSTVRAGTVFANAWNLVQKIPVMGISVSQVPHIQTLIPDLLKHQGFVLPEYNGEPNIRMKKEE